MICVRIARPHKIFVRLIERLKRTLTILLEELLVTLGKANKPRIKLRLLRPRDLVRLLFKVLAVSVPHLGFLSVTALNRRIALEAMLFMLLSDLLQAIGVLTLLPLLTPDSDFILITHQSPPSISSSNNSRPCLYQ